jgi:hypothetical protein
VTGEAPADVLRTRLRGDLRRAIKAQRRDEMTALRTLIAAIDNAESVENSSPARWTPSAHVAAAVRGLRAGEAARRVLSEHELRRVIDAELWERGAQAEKLELLGRADEASRLRFEADLIARYRTPDD